ncbi:hypothetical protein Tco_0272503 [Tanacetum coccineum]
METQAIDDQYPLVNYDNDNENDNLGYQSEEYFDEVQEDDENNHSNGNVVKRGITRLYKFRREYGKPDGIKLSVTFDALNRISGKHRALFSSFLGDMRYFDVDLTVRKLIKKKKEIEPDEEPVRGTLWLKGGVNKDGEYPDDEIRSVGDKLKETEDKIKDETLTVGSFTDAMTIVLGKEKGGYARGVGSGVTYKRYFDLPRSRQASDERILLLQSQLDNERRERQEKELLIQNLSNKMSQTEGMVTKLKNQLAAQGGQFQSMSTQLTPPNVSPVDINPINSSADEEGGTTVVGCENDASIHKSNELATLEKEMETRDCVQSVIDTSLVDAACIPDVGNNGFKIVKDAVVFDTRGFCFLQATPPSTIQMNVENKTAPKLETKRKNVYVSSDVMQGKLRRRVFRSP